MRRDFAPPAPSAVNPIVLPDRFDRLNPLAKAMLENELNEMSCQYGLCLLCQVMETSTVGVAVYPPAIAAKLGAPPNQWLALGYRLCEACRAQTTNKSTKRCFESTGNRRG